MSQCQAVQIMILGVATEIVDETRELFAWTRHLEPSLSPPRPSPRLPLANLSSLSVRTRPRPTDFGAAEAQYTNDNMDISFLSSIVGENVKNYNLKVDES